MRFFETLVTASVAFGTVSSIVLGIMSPDVVEAILLLVPVVAFGDDMQCGPLSVTAAVVVVAAVVDIYFSDGWVRYESSVGKKGSIRMERMLNSSDPIRVCCGQSVCVPKSL